MFTIDQFPLQTYDKLRFRDTDKQGHVNNAVFSTFLESGRSELLYLHTPLHDPLDTFVIAHLSIDYLHEIIWPGTVEIGTGVKGIGNASVTLLQGVFQDGICVAKAETVVVHVDHHTKKSKALSERARVLASKYLMTNQLD